MRKDFYIFRHGETELNRQKRWQGSGMNYDLNENGIAQAIDLLDKLRDKKLDIIFSSPLIRAKHTADTVAKGLNISVIEKDDLRECFYGKAEGQLITDLEKNASEILNNWYHPDEKYLDIRFSDGESKREARDRVLKVLKDLTLEEYTTIGIAIHGGTMGQLLNYFEIPYDTIPNCGAFHVIYENGSWSGAGKIF